MPDHKNVVVAVRCRPLNAREKKRNGSCLVTMQGQQTTLDAPADNQQRSNGQRRRLYNFDYSYWSATDQSDPLYASQETVFEDIGRAVLDHALSGYHCCVFAYGQTGSGKSYTMMGGQGKDAGLIPRICQELFTAIGTSTTNEGTDIDESFHVEVSYLEIYNERVRDLLNPRQESSGLRVREHPSLGPYVEDLTKAAVSSIDQVLAHMSQGNKARTVAATNMNEASSRSHAVFTIMLTRRTHNRAMDTVSERMARISLVDLAGSERATATMAMGVRLKEGARINQSLAALGKVISALADQEERTQKSVAGQTVPASGGFVPYRDSVLTWLLKDSLGGNSRTIMIATISPSDYGETLSTLRYADRAKHIINVATVNEDANVKLVRELKEEIAELRKRLALAGPNSAQGGDLEDQLVANEKLIAEMNQTWEQKLQRTQTLQMEREQALAALGISIDTNSAGMGVGLHAPRDIPHLVNLSEDPLMSECLVYNIKPGRTLVGTATDVDIRLGGNNVCAHHCWFNYDHESSALTVCPIGDSLVIVNGQHIGSPMQLYSGFRIIIGSMSVFRLNHPQQARRDRARGVTLHQYNQMNDDTTPLPLLTESTPSEMDATVDWHYAWNEAHRDESGNGYSNDSSLESATAAPAWAIERDHDVLSEMSSTGHSFPNAHALDIIYSQQQQQRPSSQISFRRNHSNLVQQQQRRWRRNSSAATDIVSSSSPYLAHSPVLARNLRTRGHTLSVVTPSASGVRTWMTTAGRTSDAQQQIHERRLARLLLRQWRQYKLVKVGEEMLRNAVHLKEANVIAKELGQKVVYQFAILRGGAEAFPESPLEPDALPAILSDWDTITIGDDDKSSNNRKNGRRGSLHLGAPDSATAMHSVPQVVVKVLDIAHTCWYVWSVATLHTQLDRMRRLSAVSGSYRAHLELDPFHAGAPRYSCIGTATYPVWPGARAYSTKIDTPVIDSLSRLERGRARGSMAALPVRGRGSDAHAWTVIVHIRSLHGVSESELSDIHCRMRLARVPELLDPGSNDDGMYGRNSVVLVSASADRAARHNSPVRGFGDGAINIQFRQQWTVDMLAQDTCVVVDFFGRAKPLALRRAFHEDVQMEQQGAVVSEELSSSQRLLVERLHEEELFVDSTHEVALWIRVLELDANGDWEQAPCEFSSGNPAISLRQGVQRRVEVVVGHNASTHLRFECVEALCIGRPELVDAKGRLAQTAAQQPVASVVELPGVRATVADQRVDNRCFLSAIASWDSSVLGSRLLDAPTARGMRVRLALELHTDISNGTAPLVLATTFHVRVCARQSSARGSGWLAAMAEGTSNFLRSGSTSDQSTKTNTSSPCISSLPPQVLPPLDDGVWRVFAVTLGASGPLLRGKADMWRLNTGNKYVRGEEALLPWQPRGVAFVEHFHRTEMRDAWRLRVARTREHLEAMGPIALRLPCKSDVAELRQCLTKDNNNNRQMTVRQQHIIDLVTEAVSRIEQIYAAPHCQTLGLYQEPQQRVEDASLPRSLGDIRRLVQRTPLAVRPIEMLSHGLIRGWVDVLDTNRSPDTWVRRWLVVERPYLLMFVDDACRFLDNVVGIASARVEADAHVSEVAGRPHVVALYASTSAYLLAPPAAELQQWIAALDEWYFML
ncbi:hypothetical protein IW140_002125 [Coemansia sp. RSA 1813]|nr:hypothetical protein EV178_001274 [Coemansia sp. RSA 1646]KAJ1772625.1 hypothetical protein LPJ74_001341 [Coemansia sp. RSA 1843]KAJ2090235.1 hypothetical protein IW138_002867 [Coemansia sp. RSA 986]KAJ2214639.1 hypothetical protein EV179_002898 [Coemansia sp. RSA 487]KAJ2570699.1 hypothetical protein IW140_002125 [Coemansia sp. RSA 1813]